MITDRGRKLMVATDETIISVLNMLSTVKDDDTELKESAEETRKALLKYKDMIHAKIEKDNMVELTQMFIPVVYMSKTDWIEGEPHLFYDNAVIELKEMRERCDNFKYGEIKERFMEVGDK